MPQTGGGNQKLEHSKEKSTSGENDTWGQRIATMNYDSTLYSCTLYFQSII